MHFISKQQEKALLANTNGKMLDAKRGNLCICWRHRSEGLHTETRTFLVICFCAFAVLIDSGPIEKMVDTYIVMNNIFLEAMTGMIHCIYQKTRSQTATISHSCKRQY